MVGDHFLLDSVSDYGGQALPSRYQGSNRRIPDEEVFGKMFENSENQFANPEIWSLDPDSFEGEIPVKKYTVSRISEPGIRIRKDFWRELRERYSEEDRKATQAKI